MSAPALPPVGPDMRRWARNLTTYLRRYMDRIRFKSAGDNPSEDGVFLWDASLSRPVVSKDGAFLGVVLLVDPPASATASGTAGQIAFDASYIYICTATDTWQRAAIATW